VVGDPSVLTNWVSYDEPVLAVADGVVVAAGDGLDDQPPGTLPDPSTITLDTVNGNYVVIDVGRGLHVFYAHLRKGTVAVERGDAVRAGEVLGRLGNSGNTSAPHLHIHLMNGPSPLGSDGLPFVHRSFTLTGAVDPVQWEESMDLSGTWGDRDQSRPVPRSLRLPLDLSIVTFPR
jgi:murein DD-endopeptidase MepM/ murein hydrolase activator NlpD